MVGLHAPEPVSHMCALHIQVAAHRKGSTEQRGLWPTKTREESLLCQCGGWKPGRRRCWANPTVIEVNAVGWGLPHRIWVQLKPRNGTLLGNWAFADVTSQGSRDETILGLGGPQLQRQRRRIPYAKRRHTGRRPYGAGQRLERCGHKPRNAWRQRQLEEAGRASPRALRGSIAWPCNTLTLNF